MFCHYSLPLVFHLLLSAMAFNNFNEWGRVTKGLTRLIRIDSKHNSQQYSFLTLNLASEDETSAIQSSPTIKEKLASDMKAAMKAKEKIRLSGIRAIQTAIKQREVDDRIVVDDSIAIEIMSKMLKQRKDSIKSYSEAGRMDLVEQEEAESKVILSYMPAPASKEEIDAMIEELVKKLDAKSVKDMAKIMTEIRPRLAGRADMGEVGAFIKKRLSS